MTAFAKTIAELARRSNSARGRHEHGLAASRGVKLKGRRGPSDVTPLAVGERELGAELGGFPRRPWFSSSSNPNALTERCLGGSLR